MNRTELFQHALDDGLSLRDALEAAKAVVEFLGGDVGTVEAKPKAKPSTKLPAKRPHKKKLPLAATTVTAGTTPEFTPVMRGVATDVRRNISAHRPRIAEPEETFTRKCLNCQKTYKTDSPFIRRCNACKNSDIHRGGGLDEMAVRA